MKRAERQTLQELMVRLAEGDRGAFHSAFRLLHPLMLGLARRLLGSAADADDVAQEALLRVFSRASEFDPSRDALAWSLAVAANECRTSRKKKLRRRLLPDAERSLDRAQDDGPSVEDLVAERKLFGLLDEVLQTLSPEDREAITCGHTSERSADIQPATLRKRKQRALTRLRAAWRKLYGIV